MAKFVVKGTLDLGREVRKFEREFEATSQKRAGELALSYFGSKSGLKRSAVNIIEIAKTA